MLSDHFWQSSKTQHTIIMIMIIIYVYQLGTGGRIQEAKPIRDVYP